MKKYYTLLLASIFMLSTQVQAQRPQRTPGERHPGSAPAPQAQPTKPAEVMTKEKGGIYVINTTTLTNQRGFRGPTPLTVTIKKGVIQKVEALPNRETPKFFEQVQKNLLPKFEGLKVEKHDEPDCVTGATLSSRAVKENVKQAVDYYNKNK